MTEYEEKSEFPMAKNNDVLTLGTCATGSLEPGNRDISEALVNDFCEQLTTDRFYVRTEIKLPCGCVDGRHGAGICPNAAGGTLSVVVADALTSSRFRGNAEDVAVHAAALTDAFDALGLEIGGHGDDSAVENGCGANAKLALVLDKIMESSKSIFSLMETLGIAVGPDYQAVLVSRARQLLDEHYTASAGKPVFDALAKNPDHAMPLLKGAHGEIAVVINTVSGTTLDRNALRAVYGDAIQTFNVDVWSFEAAASIGSKSDGETHLRVAAMVVYNLATAMVLAGPSLRIIIR